MIRSNLLRMLTLTGLVVALGAGGASAASLSFNPTSDDGSHAVFDVIYNPEGAAGVTVIDVTGNFDNPGNVSAQAINFDCTGAGTGAPGACFFNFGYSWTTAISVTSALGDFVMAGFNNVGADSPTAGPILMAVYAITYTGPVSGIVSGAPASNFGEVAGPLPNNSPPGTVLFSLGAVPEPGALLLLGAGLAGLAFLRRR